MKNAIKLYQAGETFVLAMTPQKAMEKLYTDIPPKDITHLYPISMTKLMRALQDTGFGKTERRIIEELMKDYAGTERTSKGE